MSIAFKSLSMSIAIWLLLFATAPAQESKEYSVYSDKQYADLSGVNAPDIPVGKKITLSNWRQYKNYMPIGMQALWSGQFSPFKLGPDFVMEVGPTIPIPEPKVYMENTEKYGEAQLSELPDGGTTLQHYVAGKPFLNPAPPREAEKWMWNYYYKYQPWIAYHVPTGSVQIDSDLAVSKGLNWQVYYRLSHRNDPGIPVNEPSVHDVDKTQYNVILEPEQSKYSIALTLFHSDPNKVEERYSFVPTLRRSLRRSLRLSTSARCARAGDYTPEDANQFFNGTPTRFYGTFLGIKKILAMVHADDRQEVYNNFLLDSAFFPKPVVGKWELCKVAVIDLRRIKSEADTYCYGSRVLYLDTDQVEVLFADLYDKPLKRWKFAANLATPHKIPETGEGQIGTLTGPLLLIDLQTKHETAGPVDDRGYPPEVFDGDTKAIFQGTGGVKRYTTPAGLDEIMR